MTRAEFLELMQAELEAFDKHFATKYPNIGEPGDESEDMGFGDWFEQYLAFNDDPNC